MWDKVKEEIVKVGKNLGGSGVVGKNLGGSGVGGVSVGGIVIMGTRRMGKWYNGELAREVMSKGDWQGGKWCRGDWFMGSRLVTIQKYHQIWVNMCLRSHLPLLKSG